MIYNICTINTFTYIYVCVIYISIYIYIHVACWFRFTAARLYTATRSWNWVGGDAVSPLEFEPFFLFNWEVLSKTNEVPWKLMKPDEMTKIRVFPKEICWKWRVKAWMIHHHLADLQVDLHHFQLKQWIPTNPKDMKSCWKESHTYSIILKTTAVANPEIKHKHKHRHTPRNSIIQICRWETKTTCIHTQGESINKLCNKSN